jgi:glycine cleavage system regulatory protein
MRAIHECEGSSVTTKLFQVGKSIGSSTYMSISVDAVTGIDKTLSTHKKEPVAVAGESTTIQITKYSIPH